MAQRLEDINLKRLKEGCILAAIAHAVMVEEYPELANEHSWDGINYNVQDSSGCKGTITFYEDQVVAVFQDYRQLKKDNYGEAEIDKILAGADKKIIHLAYQEALQYTLEEINGKIVPYISTAFWGEKDCIYSNDRYNQMLEKGGYIIESQLKDIKDGLDDWQEYYDMSEEQRELVEVLFKRKIALGNEKMILTEDEKNKLIDLWGDELNESTESLKELSIYFK